MTIREVIQSRTGPNADQPATGYQDVVFFDEDTFEIRKGDGTRWISFSSLVIANVKNFGAKGDNATNDTAAIQAALNSGKPAIYFPPGTYLTNALTIPATVKRFFGSGRGASTLKPTGVLGGSGKWITATSVSDLNIEDLTFEISSVTYAASPAVSLESSTNCHVQRCHFTQSGQIALNIDGCSDCIVDSCDIASYGLIGVFIQQTGGNSSRNTVSNCRIDGTGGASHAIQFKDGSHHKAIGNHCENTTQFGVNFFRVDNGIIACNTLVNTTIEGINLQDCLRIIIEGNTISYSGANGSDFGLSIYGDPAVPGDTAYCIVKGNRISNPGKSGIALARRVFDCVVEGNHVYQCNHLNEAQGAGIILYGPECERNLIKGNKLVGTGATMKYGINEWNDGSGNPGFNTVIDNEAYNYATAETNRLTNNTHVWELGFKGHTPTISALAGTITASTAASKYQQRGNLVHFQVEATITNNGTGAGAVVISLPISAVRGQVSGREAGLTGSMITGDCSGASMVVRTYNNAYPGGTGAVLKLSGTYEIS